MNKREKQQRELFHQQWEQRFGVPQGPPELTREKMEVLYAEGRRRQLARERQRTRRATYSVAACLALLMGTTIIRLLHSPVATDPFYDQPVALTAENRLPPPAPAPEAARPRPEARPRTAPRPDPIPEPELLACAAPDELVAPEATATELPKILDIECAHSTHCDMNYYASLIDKTLHNKTTEMA